jgi:single-stranded-DNA-specific exonuclease
MSINPILETLLEKRGILPAEQDHFLHPDFARDTHSPNLMKGMSVAVTRIVQAIEGEERIGIFGDYDADGVPATALLVRCFERLGVKVLPRIPTRSSGYGLTAGVVSQLLEDTISLLITVDNGTVAKAEISTLAKAGMDVIVCDHHEPHSDQIATQALAILNPKQEDCAYPFKELCGCAIGWKLMCAVFTALGKPVDQLKWELDLVALSTIADMVPLLGENRVLALYGLQVMRKSRNLGLQQLAAAAGASLADISAGSIGFRLAPRINAPSRMHSEVQSGHNVPLQLLTTTNGDEAARLAQYLDAQNGERQALLEKSLNEAEKKVEAYVESHCLVIYEPSWSTGVIGLLAGRLLEKYGRPVVILADEDGVVKGSVRSVEGIHALALMEAGSAYLERFGGHSKAGGLTMKQPDANQTTADVVVAFQSLLTKWTMDQGMSLSALMQAARRAPDLDISLSNTSVELAQELELLEPYGIGFPTPVFTCICTLENIRRVGKEQQHLSCYVKEGGSKRKAIGFSLGKEVVDEETKYQLEFRLGAEEWQGTRTVTCFIQRLSPL